MPVFGVNIAVEPWRMAEPFRIAGHIFDALDLVTVTISHERRRGRGEAAGVFFAGETACEMVDCLEAARPLIEAGITRDELQSFMPPGGARNAVDCALWELESYTSCLPVWAVAGLSEPKPLRTSFTLGGGEPAKLAAAAKTKLARAKAIKLKLLGDGGDADRIVAVREARPDVWLGVDANQSFDPDQLAAVMPTLENATVALIEQPLPVSADGLMDRIRSPIPFAADESARATCDLERLVGRFDVINIKLDKSGGLTEALRMAREARRLGFGVMVGSMPGTSLAMAPAALVGQLCDLVDLDAPLFLQRDRDPSVRYENGMISVSDNVWGWLP